MAERSFDSLRSVALLETKPEHFIRVLEAAGVSTNNFLRRLHNFAVDVGWLPWPVLPKRQLVSWNGWERFATGPSRMGTR